MAIDDIIDATSMNELAVQANKNAHEKGWWDDGRKFDGVLMLIVSEAAEALEEWRNNKEVDEVYFSIPDKRPELTAYEDEDLRMRVYFLEQGDRGHVTMQSLREEFTEHEITLMQQLGTLKPEGIPSELADIIIRVFDAAVEYNIDIEGAVIDKMIFNLSRPFKHGGKRS